MYIFLMVFACERIVLCQHLTPGHSAGLSGSIGGGARAAFRKKSQGYEALLSKVSSMQR